MSLFGKLSVFSQDPIESSNIKKIIIFIPNVCYDDDAPPSSG